MTYALLAVSEVRRNTAGWSLGGKMTTGHEWVEVLVPKHLVPEVYGLVSDRMQATNGAGGEGSLVQMFEESPPAMKAVFEFLAANSGNEMTSAEICEAIS